MKINYCGEVGLDWVRWIRCVMENKEIMREELRATKMELD